MENEESQLSCLEEVLREHREFQQRITKVTDELFDLEGGDLDEESPPDAVDGTNLTVTATARGVICDIGKFINYTRFNSRSLIHDLEQVIGETPTQIEKALRDSIAQVLF